MSRRKSFTERRRARLAFKSPRLDKLETRNTITEPISVTGLSLTAFRGLVQLGIMQAGGVSDEMMELLQQGGKGSAAGGRAPNKSPLPTNFIPVTIGARPHHAAPAGGGSSAVQAAAAPAAAAQSSDWLTLSDPAAASSAEPQGISTPWHPVARAGGGAAMAPRGGSGNGALPVTLALVRGQIAPLHVPQPALAPSTPGGGGASAALLAALANASQGNGGSGMPGPVGGGRPAAASHLIVAPSAPSSPLGGQQPGPGHTVQPLTVSGGATPPSSVPDPIIGTSSDPSEEIFPYFDVYVLDNNNGVVLFPGADQLATFDGLVELKAQVSGATVSSYSWNTTNLGAATSISGTSTDELTFKWETENPLAPVTDSVTLSVTDTSSQTETYTYDFWVPTGTGPGGSGGSSNVTWPTTINPEQELLGSPSFATDNATVDATSGALDTEIDLPSYNPNVPPIALTYDSVTANPLPIVLVQNTMPATVPSTVSAQLTYNSSGGSTWYYSTSSLNPGDVQQIALQASGTASLATGRYSYSAVVTDSGSTPTTLTGTSTLLSETSSAFGDGWTLEGLEQITSASGGVILNEGDDGRSLWFSGGGGSGGGTYTDQAGEFSTLVKNSGGSYTRTLTDGTEITFNSGGYETATIDLNGLHTTYAYNGSNQLTSIEDPYLNLTTFTYSGGYLQSITDPAGRITTLTNSGGELMQAELPDGSTWGYAYNGSGLLTKITDPRSNAVSIVYDCAEPYYLPSSQLRRPLKNGYAAVFRGQQSGSCSRVCNTALAVAVPFRSDTQALLAA
jgi:YD repeat-containing protein